MSLGKAASQLKTEEFLAMIANAEAKQPSLAPEMKAKATKNLDAIKDLAKVVHQLKIQFEKTLEAQVEAQRSGKITPPPPMGAPV